MEGKLVLPHITIEKPQCFEAIQDFLVVSVRESGKSVIQVIDTITYEVLAQFESNSGMSTPAA